MRKRKDRNGRAATLATVGLVALLLGAVGTFAGNWGWHAYQERQAAAVHAAASAAAEAERRTPQGRQREALLSGFYDPGSAILRNVRRSTVDPTAWCGEVNARNRMGALVGFRRYVVVMSDAAGSAPELAITRVDPDSSDARTQAAFEGPFSAFCAAP